MAVILRTFSRAGTAAAIAAFAAIVNAATVTYTFEPPNFTVGETTPILNVPPNVGPGSFLATFTGTTFQVTPFVPNVLFSGNSLFEPLGITGPLTLAFNTPVTEIDLVFAVNNTISGGSLTLQSAVGTDTVAATLLGGPFAGGMLGFSSATPFTSLVLSALGANGAPVEFAIDNVTLTFGAVPVPEPGSAALLAIGLLACFVGRRVTR